MSFKKENANPPQAKSSSKAPLGQNQEKSVSRERYDSTTSKVLHTENNQTSMKANQDRIKTLNSFFTRKDREAESQPLMTETGIFSKKGFRPSDIKRAPYKLIDPLSKTKKNTTLKPTEIFSFQIENPKQIKEKILNFCKTNNINIIESDQGKFECQSKNQGFGIEIIKQGVTAQLKVIHLCGNENYTKDLIRAFKTEIEKDQD